MIKNSYNLQIVLVVSKSFKISQSFKNGLPIPFLLKNLALMISKSPIKKLNIKNSHFFNVIKIYNLSTIISPLLLFNELEKE